MMRLILRALCLPVLLVCGCTFTQKVQTGRQAYEVKQYAVAVRFFEKEYAAANNRQEKAQTAFLTGESFIRLNDPVSASEWYQTAYKDGFGPDALDRYAGTLRQQERYVEAIRAYEELLATSPGNTRIRSQITICRQAMDWKQNANDLYTIEPVAFNTTSSEYSAFPVGRDLLLFTSDRDARTASEPYLWTGRSFSDLYIYNGASQSLTPFDTRLNTPDNEGTAVISPDGDMLVFTRCTSDGTYDAWCRLMMSRRRGSSWGDAEQLPFCIQGINYGHPAFAANGTTLFFTSDDPEGQGGHDLYYTRLDDRGEWTTPVNLGPDINTVGDEMYPTIHRDTLYFSSNHLPGLGGLDIFKTFLMDNSRWASPINLKAPVNSGADDFGFAVDTFAPEKEGVVMQGYFTSTRAGASRNDELYAFTLRGKIPEDMTEPVPEPEEPLKPVEEHKLFLILQVAEPVFAIPGDPNSGQAGEKPLPNGPVVITKDAADQRQLTDAGGQMIIGLDWNTEYLFTARYRDHLAATWNLHTRDMVRDESKTSTTIRHTLLLDPLLRNTEIILENIFYDLDEWVIRHDARPALDELAAMLKVNPAVRIQLSSHTDCRASDEYNMELSQKRAQSAIDYLVASGIKTERLVARGFGESSPAVDCVCEQCTEEEHQKNRRTTFKIID